ncbi:medium-chain acyl-[acyl-carrier-protein] hydrolase [Paraburkholderia sp. GAS41]|uniref:thioesterase II family protein n=1 Tax=Paraburkholderia sp. GAS41 TaxID=3035134 RepID=UPI003D1B8AB0
MSGEARAVSVNTQRGWYRRFGDGIGVKQRLICFHHAGGSASAFRDWWPDCPLGTEILAAALPGREARIAEPPVDRIQLLVKHLVDALPLDRPFAFFGHSFGALVAFEVARQLGERGKSRPDHLFVSACRAPHLPPAEPNQGELDNTALIDKLLKLGGMPREILEMPEFAAMLYPVLRADLRIVDSYIAHESGELGIPITAYTGSHDESVAFPDIAAWAEHSRPGDFAIRSFEGDHFYLKAHRTSLVTDILARWKLTSMLHGH